MGKRQRKRERTKLAGKEPSLIIIDDPFKDEANREPVSPAILEWYRKEVAAGRVNVGVVHVPGMDDLYSRVMAAELNEKKRFIINKPRQNQRTCVDIPCPEPEDFEMGWPSEYGNQIRTET